MIQHLLIFAAILAAWDTFRRLAAAFHERSTLLVTTQMVHEATTDLELGDYRVKRGYTVLMSQWVNHRDPKYFPDPEAFRPERWQQCDLRLDADHCVRIQSKPIPLPHGS